MFVILELQEFGCSAKQHVKQHRVCVESKINKDKRRICSCGEPYVTKLQRDRRHGNPQRKIPGNPSKAQLGITNPNKTFLHPFQLVYEHQIFCISLRVMSFCVREMKFFMEF